QGFFQIVIGLPLLYVFSVKFGLFGVPIPWLVINIAAFVYLFLVVNSKYLHFLSINFFKKILLMPILLTFIVNLLIFNLYKQFSISFIPFILVAIFVSFCCTVIISNYFSKRKFFHYRSLYDFPKD